MSCPEISYPNKCDKPLLGCYGLFGEFGIRGPTGTVGPIGPVSYQGCLGPVSVGGCPGPRGCTPKKFPCDAPRKSKCNYEKFEQKRAADRISQDLIPTKSKGNELDLFDPVKPVRIEFPLPEIITPKVAATKVESPIPEDTIQSSVPTVEVRTSAPSEPLSTTCAICFDSEMTHVFVPCGHRSCFDCGKELSACPMCRTVRSDFIRLF